MATRQDREKATKQNERHQAILAEMLNDDANRYCADCRSKGPRWASWNLGVFVCIRCAGIHRNLGVHISKMKSVNLDTWAAEQIECIRTKGNGVVNAMYEHSLPDNFRRPTDDSGVEAFIRSKYERKQYYKKTDKSEKAAATASASTASKVEKMPKREAKKKSSQATKVAKTSVSAVPRPSSNCAIRPAASAAPAKAASPAPDLLSGLDVAPAAASPAPAQAAQPTSSNDGMGAFMGASSAPNPNTDLFGAAPAAAQPPTHQTDFFQGAPAQVAPQAGNNKDSILSLYGQQSQAVGGFAAPGGVAGANGMSAGQMAYQQQVMMQQQMQQQMYMQQQLAMQQQQLAMQHQALQVNQVQEQMARLRMGGGAPQNGQVAGWGQQPQQPQQPGQTMNNNLWN